MYFYAVSNKALNLISSYLKDYRIQVIEIEGVESEESLVTLGDLFLDLYYFWFMGMTYLTFMIEKHINTEIVLFADDT